MTSIWSIRRSATDTKLAGLCGGVAEHWQIDPVLVRVAWVLLALSGGVGVVLYVAGWLLIPIEGRTKAPIDDMLGDATRTWSKEVWVTLVVVACLAAFAIFGTASPFGVGPAIIIACIWYFGFYKKRQGEANANPPAGAQPPAGLESSPAAPQFVAYPGPPTPFTEAAETWRRRIEQHAQQSGWSAAATPSATTWPTAPYTAAPPTAPYTAAPPTAPYSPAPCAAAYSPAPYAAGTPIAEPDPEVSAHTAFLAEPDPVGLYQPVAATAVPVQVRRGDRLPARRLRLVALAVLGLTLTGLGIADRLGADISPATYASSALLVIGLTLVAATWFGRARGLLPLGLLLVPVVLATSVASSVPELDEIGRVTPRVYAQVSQLPPAGDVQQAGMLNVDLRPLKASRDVTYTAHVGTGRLKVSVPADVNVQVRYRVGAGVVEAYDRDPVPGRGLSGTVEPDPVIKNAPTVTLDLSVDRGQLEIVR